jgi:ribosomal protein L35AE/L33A
MVYGSLTLSNDSTGTNVRMVKWDNVDEKVKFGAVTSSEVFYNKPSFQQFYKGTVFCDISLSAVV